MSEEQKPKRRWVMPVLAVSLICNMLIIGIVAGFALSNRGAKGGERLDGPARSLVGTPFIRALEPENRRALYQEIRRDEDRLRENRSALRARFEALLTALNAEPFDSEVVRVILREQREIALKRQDIGEALLIEQITNLSPDERAAYAERLARDLRRLRRE